MNKKLIAATFASLLLLGCSGEKEKPKAPAAAPAASHWYEGGTLHAANMPAWAKATPENRLATAADWALKAPRVKQHVTDRGDMAALKPFANDLMACVDGAAKGEKASDSAPEVAAMCMVMLGWT